MVTGYLASLTILMHEPDQTERLLDAVLSYDLPAQSMAQSLLWRARVELALAQEDAAGALETIERLSAAQGQSSLGLLKLRGEALGMLDRAAEAEAAFEAALAMARKQGARPMEWRISLALGTLNQAQGRTTEATQFHTAARELIEELAATIADDPLREQFLQRASAMLPQTSPLSPERLAKQTYGGLTAREREVAILIAQGKANQAIADELVVSKRTVETHIGNIMFKLDCTSRTQIAIWAVETGLVSKAETEPAT
jgi:DNA-binding CsgD family transcriptional regulator